MMTSVDGRVDCAMTTQLPGVEEYYPLLDELGLQSAVSGRTTAQLELAEPGTFTSESYMHVGKEVVSKKLNRKSAYDVVVDTKGTLLWKDDGEYDTPHIIILSEQTSQEYLAYLDSKNISYIVTGEERINLARAAQLLANTFGIERLGIVGGPTINTAFLDAGLLDEVDILIGAGIDGRASFPPVFHRREDGDGTITPLKLIDSRTYASGAVLIRYKCLS